MRMTIKQSKLIKAPKASVSGARSSPLEPSVSAWAHPDRRAHPVSLAPGLGASSKNELHDVGSTWTRDAPPLPAVLSPTIAPRRLEKMSPAVRARSILKPIIAAVQSRPLSILRIMFPQSAESDRGEGIAGDELNATRHGLPCAR